MTEKSVSFNQSIGKRGEDLAVDYFIAKGYQVLGRNIRTPYGEIDLIIKNEQDLIFVEVKTRTNLTFGYGEDSITYKKRGHLVDSAEHFLEENQMVDEKWRIDVLAIMLKKDGTITDIEWFENAI